jgi:hypothetical protein
MNPYFRLAIGGAALTFTSTISSLALADLPQPGLWQQSTTTDMSGMNMPQMPQLPPEVLAQMQAAGVHMPNFSQPQTRTSQFCITPEEITNRQPFEEDEEMEDNCTQENFQMDDNGMSVDYVCTGEQAGTMHVEYTFVSSTQISGSMTMQGAGQGMAVNMQSDFNANWLGADCGNVD